MNYRLPALLLLSVTLLSACGGGSSTPPVNNPPPKDTTPIKTPPVKPLPGNTANTANFTFKASGSPTASLAPMTGANGTVGGTFENPDSTGVSGGLAVVYETAASDRISERTLGFFFRNQSGTFKVGDRLPLYNTARFFLADTPPDGATVIYGETYRSGDRQSQDWTSIDGVLIVNTISPTAIKFTLENAVMSEDIFKENDPDKFTVYGTITYDPRPQ
ncbi:hypothetical protein [Deinococcus marmoris]|uniref:Uncharacterized protein n=1 Tax=Deinococcus marmoris TaxID=249408 RepID=A0A1U7NS21_9DEIO|nr:hypothetical protein [Deinococcus marmoris]OLV15718.1 hypothetical protein BOO71_0014059 [Deinococcus marmoris]